MVFVVRRAAERLRDDLPGLRTRTVAVAWHRSNGGASSAPEWACSRSCLSQHWVSCPWCCCWRRVAHSTACRHIDGIDWTNCRELHLCARAVRFRHVAGALWIPLPDRRADRRPGVQSAAIDVFGWPVFGGPFWRWAGMRPGAVFPIQVGLILLGALGSLTLAYQISERDCPERPAVATIPVGAGDRCFGGGGSVDSVAADGDARGRLDRMKRKTSLVVIACATIVAAVGHAATVDAHSGPPFPIISNQIAGSYEVSVWTDPDATADGSAAGQFWVVVATGQWSHVAPGGYESECDHPTGGWRSGSARDGEAGQRRRLETVRGAADGSRRSLCGSGVN